MNRPELFSIQFTNAAGVFSAGDLVQGHVVIKLRKRIKMIGRQRYIHLTDAIFALRCVKFIVGMK